MWSWLGGRRKTIVVLDEKGVRRLRGADTVEQVAWDDLEAVDIRATSEGPAVDDVFWLLRGAGGGGVAVPSEQAPPGFLERLQQLPGFDDDAVIAAMCSAEDALFPCWRRSAAAAAADA